jgi:hypothetical protein
MSEDSRTDGADAPTAGAPNGTLRPTRSAVEAVARAIALADGEDYMEDCERYDRRALAALAALPATAVVNEQAEDDGLWFAAQTITEDTLQRALRRLHAAVEGESARTVDKALATNRDIRAIIAGAPHLAPGLLVAARWHEGRAAEHDSMYWKAVGAGHSGRMDALLANEHKMAAAHLRGLAQVAQRAGA